MKGWNREGWGRGRKEGFHMVSIRRELIVFARKTVVFISLVDG